MLAAYEIHSENGQHVVKVDGDVIARVKAEQPITKRTNAWQVAYEVCAEAGLPKPKWITHPGDTIFMGFANESKPA